MYNKSEYMKTYYRLNKDKWKKFNDPVKRRKRYLDNLESELFDKAKFRAQRDNREINITKDDIVIPEKCPVLNIHIVKGDKHFGPSLDRIDNNKGYIKGNVRVISKRANRLKSDATLEELKLIVEYVEKHK